MKIAICDDNQDFDYNSALKSLLVCYMDNSGIDDYKIMVYTSGLELIKTFKRHLYDYIFLDIKMPKPDGFEVASYVKDILMHVKR